MELEPEFLSEKPTKFIVSSIKQIAAKYPKLNYTETIEIQTGKFENIARIYQLSKSLKRKRNKKAKKLGEDVLAILCGANLKQDDPSRRAGAVGDVNSRPGGGSSLGQGATEPRRLSLDEIHAKRIVVLKLVRQFFADIGYGEVRGEEPRYLRKTRGENGTETPDKTSAIRFDVDSYAYGQVRVTITGEDVNTPFKVILGVAGDRTLVQCLPLAIFVQAIHGISTEFIRPGGEVVAEVPPLKELVAAVALPEKIYMVVPNIQGHKPNGRVLACCNTIEEAREVIKKVQAGQEFHDVRQGGKYTLPQAAFYVVDVTGENQVVISTRTSSEASSTSDPQHMER